VTAAAAVFERFAAGSPRDRAALLRRCAVDPLVLSLVPEEPAWDVPHRVLAAVEYLVLGGEADDYRVAEDPWEAFRAIVAARCDWVRAFVHERTIQTNDPQRSWALLPLFLTVARAAGGRPLDLLELGASAGLNLLWDRYRYEYGAGAWGPQGALLVLRGDERLPVPPELLATEVVVRRRRGVDLAPVDASTEDGIRTLFSFVTRPAYRERVALAAEVLRHEPPELVQGDYVELLPQLLAERDDAAVTVVFQTISTIYLPPAQAARVRTAVEAAAEEGPLAWISTPAPAEHGLRGRQYPLELGLWPGGGRRLVGEMSNGGDRLEWRG
jgi:hypothetical protein